ncbi:MAG: hypothetical protein JSW50_09735 [Candidatus Latescibacterota bacterium]|nr:MAG: hypothetical protein JSW50_09735 [Candidatus Latescibacterota bacterium]
MKTVLASIVPVVLAAGLAFGQAGSIGVFEDNTGADCSMEDRMAGLFVVHVVHVNTSGATASTFAAEDGPGFTGVWLSDTTPYPLVVGYSHGPMGLSQGYGACLTSPIHIASMNYFGYGTSAACSWIRVVPPAEAASGQIDVVDCNNSVVYATGGTLIVNPTDDCVCDVPADNLTWGAIKAMFHQ